MLDMALQSSHAQNYWRVEIQGTFFEPCADDKFDSDRNSTLPTTYSNDRAAVIHSLYLDWCVYARVLMALETSQSSSWKAVRPQTPYSLTPTWTSGRSAEEAASRCRLILTTLIQLIREQRHALTWETAKTLFLCANRPGNDLSALPQHLIHQEILPRVVLEETRGIRGGSSMVTSRATDIMPGPHASACPVPQPAAITDDAMETEGILGSLESVSDVVHHR
jgi:hypothetical protein